MDTNKYLAALKYESADTVLGSIMSEAQFPHLNEIGDACDIAYFTDNQHDLKLIEHHQPMFYNYKQHRLVNKADVLAVLKKLSQ